MLLGGVFVLLGAVFVLFGGVFVLFGGVSVFVCVGVCVFFPRAARFFFWELASDIQPHPRPSFWFSPRWGVTCYMEGNPHVASSR